MVTSTVHGREKENSMGFFETLGTIAVALGEAASEYANAYTDEEKIKIAEVKEILAKRGQTEAVDAIEKVMASWNTYSKASTSRSYSYDSTSDSLWEQESKIKTKIGKKMSYDQINGMYVAIDTTIDSVIVYINRSRYNVRSMRPTDVKDGAALIIRDYHIQNVVKGYNRVWANEYEATINKIADIIR